MEVFISWSGDASQSAANALVEWLPRVLQSVQPFLSSRIPKGARWQARIGEALARCSCGIICVTEDNRDAPWLNFEAGALAKSMDTDRVMPICIGIKVSDLQGPLAQFQAVLCNKPDFRKLVLDLHEIDETTLVDQKTVEACFEKWWPDLEDRLAQLAAKTPGTSETTRVPAEATAGGEVLEEILSLARHQSSEIEGMRRRLESLHAENAAVGLRARIAYPTAAPPMDRVEFTTAHVDRGTFDRLPRSQDDVGDGDEQP